MRHRFLVVVTTVVWRLFVSTPIVTGLALPSPRTPLSVTDKSKTPTAAVAGAGASIVTASTTTRNPEPLTTKPTMDANFASHNNHNHNNNKKELESDVISAIQNVASSAANVTDHPQLFFSALGDFGKASGALIGQKWLTPEALEECTLFWDDGLRILLRDLLRSYVFSQQSTRYRLHDWAALGWFTLAASSSSLIFFPLLLPLMRVALAEVGEHGIDESVYLPPSFGSTRLAAMRRLRRPHEQPLDLANGTPRNVQEGLSFFREGTVLLARDVQRGTLTARADDTWGSYGWFAFLAFSSFPLTPLLIPLIDKRRNGAQDATRDYVPSSYRPQRLQALTRVRTIAALKFGTTPVDILRAVTNAKKEERPPPQLLLEAMVQAQGSTQDKSVFLAALAGVPGRKWELAYIAGKPAVMAMRQQLGHSQDTSTRHQDQEEPPRRRASSESWYRPLERFVLPWTRLRDGLYIDSNWVSAIQNFDVQTMQNKNGVFQLFNSDFFQTTVEGPFSWDGAYHINHPQEGAGPKAGGSPRRNKNAAVCAFRPTRATFQLGPWWKIEQDIPEELPFDQTHIRDLPFFKFIHVDDRVAVALGRSGSVALWTRMPEEESSKSTCKAVTE